MSPVDRERRLEQAASACARLLERIETGGAGEAVLSAAYQLGRELLADGVSLLEVAAVQQRALRLRLDAGATLTPALEAAAHIHREMLAGYEMLLRGYSDANAALRNLNERMEEQVERIARALHDESSQLVAAVMIRLDEAAAALPAPARAELDGVRRLLDQVEAQLRRIAHELHPALLKDLGLRPALEFLADGVAARSGLVIAIEGDLPQRLPAPVELCLYRCVQECLNNVVRHAQARHVRIRLLTEAGGMEIRVGDDGRGFAPELAPTPGRPRGLGLAGMRERLRGVGGDLQIEARPGAGAELRLQVPGWREGGPYAGSIAAGR